MSSKREADVLASFARSQRLRSLAVTGATLVAVCIAVAVLGVILSRVKAASAELAAVEAQKSQVALELAKANAQLVEAKANRDDLAADIEAKTRQLTEKLRELEQAESELGQLKQAIDKSSDSALQKRVETIAPNSPSPKPSPAVTAAKPAIETVAKVRFSKPPTGEKLGERTYYPLRLSVDIPADRSGEISRVEYYFNHPSFVPRLRTSFDAASGFALAYRGWGCIRDVTVTLIGRDESRHPISFDMCKAWNGAQ
jgi:Skp family chaperone for outer membrane proteins